MTEDIFVISENFRIEKSNNNYILQENKVVVTSKDSADHKQGDECKIWTEVGHYASIIAIEWNGFEDGPHHLGIVPFLPEEGKSEGKGWIDTHEGGHIVAIGDWIITAKRIEVPV